jgi:hypothetical protein
MDYMLGVLRLVFIEKGDDLPHHGVHGFSFVADGLGNRNDPDAMFRELSTSFSYEREIQPRPKLGRWKAELDRMLTANTSNPARERLTLIRLFEELRALGYEGGYDAVRRYARSWSREHASQMADA